MKDQHARRLIEASLDPLVTISADGKIMDMNHATESITGLKRRELVGTDFFDYFTDTDKAQEVYKEVFANGSVTDMPLTLRHKKGKLTEVLFNGSVYKNNDGIIEGIVIVARDVTEQNRIASELLESKLSAEKATLIAEDAQLNAEIATKTAQDAVEAKQQFLSNMSHEIRTPMNAIVGFTKVLLKTSINEKQTEYLEAIRLSGDALIVLINDILDLAKVDAGKMVFEKTPFKLASSIHNMLHLFETKIQEKNLQLINQYDLNIHKVLIGDPIRLRQIILNLLSNAVKFTDEGTITLSVNIIKEDDKKILIEFKVADTGIGIPADKIDYIFEKFNQATTGTSRLYGGTGLGLAIVKQLVELQGGTISVESTEQVGSTFGFTLEFLKSNENSFSDVEIELTKKTEKNISVLIVEDIALNQLLVKTLLDDFNFEGDVAGNGMIAIEKMKQKKYDIILMDLQMPKMNGFQATEYIRNTLKSSIPIIALTADVTTSDIEKCKAVGMNDYLSKPINEKLLYKKIVDLVVKQSPKLNKKLSSNKSVLSKKYQYIDLDYLHSRTKSNKDLLIEMIDLFLEQTPNLIESMNDGFKNKDWDKLKGAAHKLIPSLSIVGINKEYEILAKNIQEFDTNKNIEVVDMIKKLETVCLHSCKELEEELIIIKQK